MVETPMPGRVRKVIKRRQQKAAEVYTLQNIESPADAKLQMQDKWTLPLAGDPEVFGCLWSSFTSSGWRHCKPMKR